MKKLLFIVFLSLIVLTSCQIKEENVPTAEPISTSIPTESPTVAPSEVPTEELVTPTSVPTPTEETPPPTVVPTATPTAIPTAVPTEVPTATPVPHVHTFNNKVENANYKVSGKDNEYYYSCVCGEKGTETFQVKKEEEHKHDYNNKVASAKYLKEEASCTKQAVYYYSCSCGEKGTNTFSYGDTKPHEYVNEVVKSEYQAKEATCTSEAEYYYVCNCGKISNKTYKYGDLLEHNFCLVANNAYLAKVATCTSEAEYFLVCTCGKISETTMKYGDKLSHTFTEHNMSSKFLANGLSCSHAAEYYVSCKYCDAHSNEIFRPENRDQESYKIVAIKKEPTYTENGIYTVCCDVCKSNYEREIIKVPSNIVYVSYIETKGETCINTGLSFASDVTLNFEISNYFWNKTDEKRTTSGEISIFKRTTSGSKMVERFMGGSVLKGDEILGYYYPALNKNTGVYGVYDLISGKFMKGEKSGKVTGPTELNLVNPEKSGIENFTRLTSLEFNEGDTLALNLSSTFSTKISGTSYDGKPIVPDEYDNVIFGIPTYCDNAKLFDISEIVVTNNDAETHKFIPVKRNSDGISGLYDEVKGEFFPISKTYSTELISDYFKSNNEYNGKLAELAAIYPDDQSYIDNYMKSFGFLNISSFRENSTVMDAPVNKAEYDLYKKDYLKEGKVYFLYYLYINDAKGRGEYISSNLLGEGDLHEGSLQTSYFLRDIIDGLVENSENNKIIINGVTRGAVIGSILAANYADDGKKFSSKNIYCYGIGTLLYSLRSNYYDFIFNIVTEIDVFCFYPSAKWGYRREGVEITLPISDEIFNELDELMKEYQTEKGLTVVGYTGLRYSIVDTMSPIGDIIPASIARDPNNAVMLTEIMSTFQGNGNLSMNDMISYASAFNLTGNISKILKLYKFATNNKEAITVSHEPVVYKMLTRIYNSRI